MRERIMIVGREVELRARLARLLKAGGYHIEIAESAAHARRIGFGGIALAIVAPDGHKPEEGSALQELQAAVGNVLLVAAPGSKRDVRADRLDVTDETGLLGRVAKALAPTSEEDAVEPTLQFAGYRLDLGGYSLRDPTGEEVPLTHREFSLLRVLVQKAGRVLSREQLLQILAGREAEAYDRSIDMQIVRLRRKIEPDPKHPTFIVTVPNAGYKFAAKVHQSETPAPEPQQTAATQPAATPAYPERRYITALAAELVAAAGASLVHDPEELLVVIDAYRRFVTAVITRHGGAIAESRGREVLAYFGYPVAREHAAERAIHAALALADHLAEGEAPLPAGLAVRAGVASGSVLAGPANDVIGETPSEANRLLNVAASGTVVVDEATRRLTGALFEWSGLGELPLRGERNAVRAWRALGQGVVESRFEALRAAQLGPLVGREEELELLLRRWRSAVTGEGQAVLICGEPGIGKSRLLAELASRIGSEHEVLRYYCSPYQKDTPLYPVTARWERDLGFIRGESGSERLRKLQATMEPDIPSEDFSLIADVLNLPTDGRLKLELSPRPRRERTFGLLLKLLRQRVERRPALMLLEDIHWSDASTIEPFDLLISELPNLRVLLVVSFRPEHTSPWPGQAGVTLTTLSRLTPSHSATLAGHVMHDRPLPAPILDRVVALTDGVPLFIEELTRALLERAGAESAALTVPATLQSILMARLDRVPAAKRVAQIAAVIGREAAYALLLEVSDLPEPVLAEGLASLVASGLAFRRGVPPDSTYIFKHALVQEAAYESLPRSRRIFVHATIAAALERETEFAPSPELLAHHYAEAEIPIQAVHYLLLAGEQAASRSAMQEARTHLVRGQELTAAITDTDERNLRQAEFALELSNVQMALHGFGSAEHGAESTEAVRLCRGLGMKCPKGGKMLARALFGEMLYRYHVGETLTSHSLAEELLALGQNYPDPALRADSYIAYGVSCFYLGRFMSGAQSLAAASSYYRGSEEPAVDTANFGFHGKCLLHAQFSRLLACYGFPAQSAAHAQLGLDAARQLQHLPTTATTLIVSCTTAWLLRDHRTLEARSSELVRLTRDHGFPLWLARGKCYAGWIAAARGDFENGRILMAEGLCELDNAGVVGYAPHCRAMFANVHAWMGQIGAARRLLDEAVAICLRTGEVWIESELYRQKGELVRVDSDDAEISFRKAIEVAQHQSAKLFELRASVSLARLWHDHGRSEEAHVLLAPIFSWFTEGFDTPDLIEAQSLLNELASTEA